MVQALPSAGLFNRRVERQPEDPLKDGIACRMRSHIKVCYIRERGRFIRQGRKDFLFDRSHNFSLVATIAEVLKIQLPGQLWVVVPNDLRKRVQFVEGLAAEQLDKALHLRG